MKIRDFFMSIFGFHNRTQQREATSAARSGAYRISTLLGGIGVGDAMSVAAVYRCVRFISDSVANLPMQYMRLRGGVYIPDVISRLHYLLTVQPSPTMSAADFWASAVENYYLEGNTYIVPVYGKDAEIESLILCNRGTVSHDTLNDTYTVNDTYNHLSGTYTEEEIIHWRNYSLDGKHGLPVLQFARMCVGVARAGEEETLSRFKNGGAVRGILNNGSGAVGFGEYQDAQLEKTAESIDARFQSGERIVTLPGQVGFEQLSQTSTDMQFLETRKFTVRDICRFFGVHPSFVFDDTSNNYKSAEMANVAYLSNTLNPLLRKIECEFTRKLIPRALVGKRRFQFDRMQLYACDMDSRVKYQAQTIAAGLYTVNEWRAVENKAPIDGGDVAMITANVKPLQDTQDTGGLITDSGQDNFNDNDDAE